MIKDKSKPKNVSLRESMWSYIAKISNKQGLDTSKTIAYLIEKSKK